LQTFFGHVVGPEAFYRLGASGQQVDAAKDELPLAARIRGVDDGLDVVIKQEVADDLVLLGRLRQDAQGETRRQHGQLAHGPAAGPGRVLLGRFGDVDQMPHGPGDYVSRTLQKAVPASLDAKDTCQLAGHGGLFGYDQRSGHMNLFTRDRRATLRTCVIAAGFSSRKNPCARECAGI